MMDAEELIHKLEMIKHYMTNDDGAVALEDITSLINQLITEGVKGSEW